MIHRKLQLLLNPTSCILPSLCAALIVTGAAQADLFDPPASYYDSATGTGTTLKNQLHDIIATHTVFSSGTARTALQVIDQDPADPDRML